MVASWPSHTGSAAAPCPVSASSPTRPSNCWKRRNRDMWDRPSLLLLRLCIFDILPSCLKVIIVCVFTCSHGCKYFLCIHVFTWLWIFWFLVQTSFLLPEGPSVRSGANVKKMGLSLAEQGHGQGQASVWNMHLSTQAPGFTVCTSISPGCTWEQLPNLHFQRCKNDQGSLVGIDSPAQEDTIRCHCQTLERASFCEMVVWNVIISYDMQGIQRYSAGCNINAK